MGPTGVGTVPDIIRKDLYYRHRDSDGIIIGIIDDDCREFAERLISGAGSCRGKLKEKLAIRLR